MNTRRIPAAAILLLLSAACSPTLEAPREAPEAHIEWFEGSVDEAFALARTESRPLFLYWGAEWCPPCHYLKNKIFKQPEFVAKVADFVPLYLDGDSERAQIVGERLDVKGYPTVIVFSPDGEEVMRMASSIPVTQYSDVLDAALQVMRPVHEVLAMVLEAGAANASRTDLNLLAFYSWNQDSKSRLAEADKLATFEALYTGTPRSLELQRSRFFSLYLEETLSQRRAAEEPSGLPIEQRALLRDEVLAILGDRDLRNVNLYPVTYLSRGVVELLEPEPSLSRDQLIAAWLAAARALEEDSSLSLDDRLSALAPQIALAKLQANATDEQIPDSLLKRVRERVSWAAAEVSDEGELQAVMSTMVWLLQSAGLESEAETLLTEKMDETLAPYYFMSWLASVKKEADKPTEALLWYRKAYDASRGRYSRFRWGSTYLRRLLELSPEDVETIESASIEILDELLSFDDAFSLGNHSRLKALADAYETWDEGGTRADVLARVRDRVHSSCDRFSGDDGNSQQSRCLAFLAS